MQFSPDGRWLISASFDKAIKLWDGLNGIFAATLRAHVGPVYQVAWSSDSRLFVSGSKDSTLKVRRAARSQSSLAGDELPAVLPWTATSAQAVVRAPRLHKLP